MLGVSLVLCGVVTQYLEMNKKKKAKKHKPEVRKQRA